MNMPCSSGSTLPWQWLPLCRRYAAGAFRASPVQIQFSNCVQPQAIHWALGCTRDGDCELLGVWSQTEGRLSLPAHVFVELERRGVEHMQFALGIDSVCAEGAVPAPTFGMTCMPSIEQSLFTLRDQIPARPWGEIANALRAIAMAGNGSAVAAAMATFERGRRGELYPEVVAHWRCRLAQWAPLFVLSDRLRRVVLLGDRTTDELSRNLMRVIERHGGFADPEQALNFAASVLWRTKSRLERKGAGVKPGRSHPSRLPVSGWAAKTRSPASGGVGLQLPRLKTSP